MLTFLFQGAPQYKGMDSQLQGAQQLVFSHYSEIEDCPYVVYQRFTSHD